MMSLQKKKGCAECDQRKTPLTSPGCRLLNNLAEEIPHRSRNFLPMSFQREVAGIEQADLRVGEIALIGFRPRRQEERVVLAPDRQERRPMRPEVLLERRVERDVVLVVA